MIIAILQARISSSRLPGKVLKPILGKPMLTHQIERIQRSRKIDKIVLAISDEVSDQPLVELANDIGVDYFQGPLNDVLARYYLTAKKYQPEYIVRLTGDCPVADPELIDELIGYFIENNFDYASTAQTFPDGLDAEIMTMQALSQAYEEAILPSQREHVTPFINQQPERFHLGVYGGAEDCSHLRWTVDEVEDFELITKIYESLYSSHPHFTWRDILNFVSKNPELVSWNAKYARNEGYQKSLQEDLGFLNNI